MQLYLYEAQNRIDLTSKQRCLLLWRSARALIFPFSLEKLGAEMETCDHYNISLFSCQSFKQKNGQKSKESEKLKWRESSMTMTQSYDPIIIYCAVCTIDERCHWKGSPPSVIRYKHDEKRFSHEKFDNLTTTRVWCMISIGKKKRKWAVVIIIRYNNAHFLLHQMLTRNLKTWNRIKEIIILDYIINCNQFSHKEKYEKHSFHIISNVHVTIYYILWLQPLLLMLCGWKLIDRKQKNEKNRNISLLLSVIQRPRTNTQQ